MKKKIAFRTLGCKLNQYETDSLAAQFLAAGYEVVEDQDGADATIVNTCTVTLKSDRKSRNTINHVRTFNPGKILVVTGCYGESSKQALEAQDGITYLVDNQRKTNIFALVDAHFHGEIIDPRTLQPDLFAYPSAESPFHTRGLVKVQDGCDNFCSYCIIPSVRGPGISRAPQQILEDIRSQIGFGVKEIVLTGVNVSRYDHSSLNFETLLGEILALPGDFRLRVSSLEPECLGDRFFDLLLHEKMAKHLHLCLQSGNERILKAMSRQYTLSQYTSLVDKIRKKVPLINLTTDLIVGFPGETDQEFQSSLKVCRELEFGQVHVFKYSQRPDTPAASMPGALPERVKSERALEASQTALELQTSYRKRLIGKPQRVLVERVNNPNQARGLGENYVPVQVNGTNLEWNTFVNVTISDFPNNEEFLISDATK